MARKLGLYVAPILVVLVMAPASAAMAVTQNARSASSSVCKSWAHTTSRNAGTGDNNLYGVTALSARNAWAVGEYFVGVDTSTLVEHWNGKSWKIVPSPNVDSGDALQAVYAVSANNVWAAGSYYNGAAGQTLIEHWNGKSWKVVPSPNVGPSTNQLFSIRGTSSRDIWAAGYSLVSYPMTRNLILHWNGHHWRVAASPNVAKSPNSLDAVRPLSPANSWAVGRYLNGSVSKTLILHWGNGHWRAAHSPNVGTGTNTLRGVLSTSAANAWTVGDYYNGTVDKTLTLHWNGRHWVRSYSPNVGKGSNDLSAIGGTSSKNIYAVGDANSKALILHWNGYRWRVMPGPNPGTANDELDALFALSPTSIWAVGSYSSGGFNRTFIEHCR